MVPRVLPEVVPRDLPRDVPADFLFLKWVREKSVGTVRAGAFWGEKQISGHTSGGISGHRVGGNQWSHPGGGKLIGMGRKCVGTRFGCVGAARGVVCGWVVGGWVDEVGGWEWVRWSEDAKIAME